MTEVPISGVFRRVPEAAARGMAGATGVEAPATGSRAGFVNAAMSGGATERAGWVLTSRATWMACRYSSLGSRCTGALGGLLPSAGKVGAGL